MTDSSMHSSKPKKSDRFRHITLWAGRILVALFFMATGSAKIFGAEAMVHGFDQIGFGQWFRYFTGGVEWLGAALLLWPAASPLGALIVIGISVGAFFVQLFAMHGDVIHTIVLLSAGVALTWVQRWQLLLIFGRTNGISA